MRIRVSDILEMLGEGVSAEEILTDFRDLERADIDRDGCVHFDGTINRAFKVFSGVPLHSGRRVQMANIVLAEVTAKRERALYKAAASR